MTSQAHIEPHNPNQAGLDCWSLNSSAEALSDAQLVSLPFLGRSVSCGLFGIGDDFIEKYQSLDARFIKNKESTFFFRSVGSSMAPTIFPGEVLIVDRSIEATNGRVCILAYEDELICKRVYRYSNFAILKSDNPKHQNIRINNPDSVLIWGVVVARAAEVR